MIGGITEITMIATITRWKLLLHDRQSAEEVAAEQERSTQATAADDVVDGERRVGHRADAGDERRERADDRHEAREDDRLAAVLLVELVRALAGASC